MNDQVSDAMKKEVAQKVLVRIMAIMQNHQIAFMDLDANLRSAITEVFQYGVSFFNEEFGYMGKDVT